MIPKEKAYEIYEKIFCITPEDLTNDECVKFAKQCALIAVDEIINLYTYDDVVLDWKYWQEVKQEINNL